MAANSTAGTADPGSTDPLAAPVFVVAPPASGSGLLGSAIFASPGSWHAGEAPDPRAVAVAQTDNVDIGDQVARQIHARDFEKHDWIVALDGPVLKHLQEMRPAGARAEVTLLLDHVEGRAGDDVADPYYGEDDGFAVTWADVKAGATALADRIEAG